MNYFENNSESLNSGSNYLLLIVSWVDYWTNEGSRVLTILYCHSYFNYHPCIWCIGWSVDLNYPIFVVTFFLKLDCERLFPHIGAHLEHIFVLFFCKLVVISLILPLISNLHFLFLLSREILACSDHLWWLDRLNLNDVLCRDRRSNFSHSFFENINVPL